MDTLTLQTLTEVVKNIVQPYIMQAEELRNILRQTEQTLREREQENANLRQNNVAEQAQHGQQELPVQIVANADEVEQEAENVELQLREQILQVQEELCRKEEENTILRQRLGGGPDRRTLRFKKGFRSGQLSVYGFQRKNGIGCSTLTLPIDSWRFICQNAQQIVDHIDRHPKMYK